MGKSSMACRSRISARSVIRGTPEEEKRWCGTVGLDTDVSSDSLVLDRFAALAFSSLASPSTDRFPSLSSLLHFHL